MIHRHTHRVDLHSCSAAGCCYSSLAQCIRNPKNGIYIRNKEREREKTNKKTPSLLNGPNKAHFIWVLTNTSLL